MFTRDLASMLLNQTVSLLVVSYLGAASLALLARPTALVRIISNFMAKYANVFTPTLSSLKSVGEVHGLRELTLKATRFGITFSLPPLIFLTIFGDHILQFWMGGRYAAHSLMIALVGAQLFSIAHAPLYFVLCGLNQHGRVSFITLLAAASGIALSWISFRFLHSGLVGSVIAYSIPWTLVNGVYLPLHACSVLNISVMDFLKNTWKIPILSVIPFASALISLRAINTLVPPLSLAVAGAVGGAVLAIFYWRFALPHSLKSKISSLAGLKLA